MVHQHDPSTGVKVTLPCYIYHFVFVAIFPVLFTTKSGHKKVIFIDKVDCFSGENGNL